MDREQDSKVVHLFKEVRENKAEASPKSEKDRIDLLIEDRLDKIHSIATDGDLHSVFIILVPKESEGKDGVPLYSFAGRWGLKDWVTETDFMKNFLLAELEEKRIGED